MRNIISLLAGALPFIPITALLILQPAHALSPPPPQADDELLPLLYEAFDGDHWRNNDGWLDEDVHWCDWYGVTCGDEFWPGLFELEAIELPNNNLRGELTAELLGLLFLAPGPQDRLDLSNNAISGTLDRFPARTRVVDLSDNRLSGALPEVESGVAHEEWKRLLLAGNRFEGSVPESWRQLELVLLDLADNRLDRGHLNAFGAMHRTIWGHLDLAGNRFSATLTTDILPAKLYRRDISNVGGGINLCFNDFEIHNPDVSQWVADRHAAGPDFEQCLGRERAVVSSSISGSWYHPDRAGEGVVLHLLANGRPLLYSFSFDALGRQQWLFEVGIAGERFSRWPRLLETRGHFGQGIAYDGDHPFIRGMSSLRVDRIGADTLHLERNYYDQAGCGPWERADPDLPPMPGLCAPGLISDRLDYTRLSELAGTTCDNQSDFQQYSGVWYDPERSGEGFIVEVLPDDRAVVYWFTYRPDDSGRQAWMMGDGTISTPVIIPIPPPSAHPDALVVIDELAQPVGGVYGPDFDPGAIEKIRWGTLRIEFHDDNTGHVFYDSELGAYGSGDYPVERLARPTVAPCE